MSQTPEEIRAEIERTRNNLGSDVDALADKVTPSKIVQRQTDKVKNAFGSVKDTVMGSAHDASGSVSGAASSAGDAVSGVAQAGVQKAKGNPLAVGLIAFGVGWLAASRAREREGEGGRREGEGGCRSARAGGRRCCEGRRGSAEAARGRCGSGRQGDRD